jgi:hypothetical protein
MQDDGLDYLAVDIVLHSHDPSQQFQASLLGMLKTEALCDLTFCVKASQSNGGGWARVKAHRVVMAAVSPVLRKLFTAEEFREGREKGEVHLEELDEEALSWIIQFVYSGSVKLDGPDSLLRLYQAADRLDIPTLREVCVPNVLVWNRFH